MEMDQKPMEMTIEITIFGLDEHPWPPAISCAFTPKSQAFDPRYPR